MPLSLFEQIEQLTLQLRKVVRNQRPFLLPGSKLSARTLEGKYIDSLPKEEKALTELLGLEETSPAYQVFKSTIFKKLLNAVVIVDFNADAFSYYAIALQKANKLLLVAKTLSYLGLREIAERVSMKGLAISQEYELSSNCVEFLTILLNGAVLRADKKKFKRYRLEQTKWLEVYNQEIELFGSVSSLNLEFAKQGSDRPQVQERIFHLAEFAADAHRKHGIFSLAMYKYRLRALAFQSSGQYTQCISVCSEAIETIKRTDRFYSKARVAEFALKTLVCCCHLQEYQKGREAFDDCASVYKPGMTNWFVAMEYNFLLQMSALKFEEASVSYTEVSTHPSFSTLDGFRRERWKLYSLYLMYARHTLEDDPKIRHRKTLTFRDVANWTSSHSGDKAGYNMSLLILHILLLISKKDWLGLVDRLQAVESYRLRYLKNRQPQANAFVQLLTRLEKADFRIDQLPEDSKKLVETLDSQTDGKPVLEGLQIIPFSWLWKSIETTLSSAK